MVVFVYLSYYLILALIRDLNRMQRHLEPTQKSTTNWAGSS